MFPINFNFPYRKKDGSVITMEKALDGAGADLDLIDLDDVAVQTPADNEGLVYNGSTQKWKNEPVVTGDLWAENAAHNVLPYPYKDGTNTYSNVEITVNSDGSISGTGTSNDSNAFRLLLGKMRKGAYKLRFNGTITNCYLSVYDTTSSTTLAETTSGNTDISFTIDATNADHQIQIHILFGTDKAVTINGKPLLRMASDPSTANAPYAMTNGELTENKLDKNNYRYKDITLAAGGNNVAQFIHNMAVNIIDDFSFYYVGESITGTAVWTSHGYYSFIMRLEYDNKYDIFVWSEGKMYTARYIPDDSFYAYEYTGTLLQE